MSSELSPPSQEEETSSSQAIPVPVVVSSRNSDAKLSKGQEAVFEAVQQGNNVFFTGSAGTGKSFLLAKIIKELKFQRKQYVLSAATGIAAVNIGGCTFHAATGIKLGKGSVKQILMTMSHFAQETWRTMDVLIVDEISMIDGETWDKVEEIARIMRMSDRPFGGIQLVICGDFLQLPPVKARIMCFEAKTWDLCMRTQIQLTKVFRQKDKRFVHMLQELREGYISDETLEILYSRLMPVGNAGDVTKLYTKNDGVNNENQSELAKIKDEDMIYTAMDVGDDNMITQLEKHCIAATEINVKIGARVMLVKNIDSDVGLVNGSIGYVTKYTPFRECKIKKLQEDGYRGCGASPDDEFPTVEFKDSNGRIRELDCVPSSWSVEDARKEKKATRYQIPLKLAWAVTIHKCQGTTLDEAQMRLDNCFAAGQAYVALSRVRNIEGIQLTAFNPLKLFANQKVIDWYHNNFPNSVAVCKSKANTRPANFAEKYPEFAPHRAGAQFANKNAFSPSQYAPPPSLEGSYQSAFESSFRRSSQQETSVTSGYVYTPPPGGQEELTPEQKQRMADNKAKALQRRAMKRKAAAMLAESSST